MNREGEDDEARVVLKGRSVSTDWKQLHQQKNQMPAVREGSSFWTCPVCQTSVHTALRAFHISACPVLAEKQQHDSRVNAKEEKKMRVSLTEMGVDEHRAEFEEPAMLTPGDRERISNMEVGRSNDNQSERLMPGPETPAQEGRDLNMRNQTPSSICPSPLGEQACTYDSKAVAAVEDGATATEVKRRLFPNWDEKLPTDWGDKLPTDSDEEEEERKDRIFNADVLSVSSTDSHFQQGTAKSTIPGGRGAPRQIIDLDSGENDDIAEFGEFETPSEGRGRTCNGEGKAGPRIMIWNSLDSGSGADDDISDADTLPYLGSVRDSQEPESEDPKVEGEEEDESKGNHARSSASISNAGKHVTGRETHEILQSGFTDAKPRSGGRSPLNLHEPKMRPYLRREIEEQEEQSARRVDTGDVRIIDSFEHTVLHEKRSGIIEDTREVPSRREAELEGELSSLREKHFTALARIAELEQILATKNEECQKFHTPQQEDSSMMMDKEEDEVMATQILSQTSTIPGLRMDSAKGEASYPHLVVDLEIDKQRPADVPRTNVNNRSTVRQLFLGDSAEATQPLVQGQLEDSGLPRAAALRSGSIVTPTPVSDTLKPATYDAHATGERPGESEMIGEAATTPSLPKGLQTAADKKKISASDSHCELFSEMRDEIAGNCRNKGLISSMLDNFPPAQGTESQQAIDPFQIYSFEATQEKKKGPIPVQNDVIIIESDEEDEMGVQKTDTGDVLVQQHTAGILEDSLSKEEYVLHHERPKKKQRKLLLSNSDSDESSGSADRDKNYGDLVSDSSIETDYGDDVVAYY